MIIQVNIMTFLNAMINARDLLDGRVAVRQEAVDLGLLKVIHETRQWIDAKRAVGEHTEHLGQLSAQFDVFEEAMNADKRETTRNGLDLSYVARCLLFAASVGCANSASLLAVTLMLFFSTSKRV